MTVAFDAKSSAFYSSTTAGATGSINMGSSATALVVAVGGYIGLYGYSSLTTRTVTVGTGGSAKSLVLLGAMNGNNSAGYGWVELWGVINPPTGTQSIRVVETIGSSAVYLECYAESFTGASQFGTCVTNYGSGSAVTSGSILSAVGNMVFNVVGSADGTLSAPSGTSRWVDSATPNYMTLLAQDSPGAARVTQTCTASSLFGWATASVNLIAGVQINGNASASMTLTSSASSSYAGNPVSSGSIGGMTLSASASGLVTTVGPPLRYVGRYPDTDSTIVPVAYAKADNASVAVSPAWVTQQVNIAAANCVTQAWVQGQIANYQTQTAITTALNAYIPKSALGASSGIAVSDTTNNIPSAQLPTLVTNSLAKCYDVATNGTQLVSSTTTVVSTTQNINEIVLAQITVPDPGYEWICLPFAYVRAAAGGTSSLLTSGTGNVGCLTVVPEGQVTNFYGVGICTDDPNPNYYPLMPYGLAVNTNNVVAGAMTPTTNPPLPATTSAGSTVFQLGACNLPGVANSNNYLFSGANLVFYILVLPAVS